ncbi:hypothetical protein SAMN05421820_103157 [Pedobacter steynii]|uniref:Uncharacterized protein n=1 Tax=Pedobacter steynii TaxID=430522 RepID=A0A1G9R7S7_9SPHI|nr:hypothetical protein [Pedobacter steynii]NQX37841.1 hypothetical protein [Pedobacter steynii]SDM19336.1 hypothetical protein SAMN05421820_103157 [Pedobacter steynii]
MITKIKIRAIDGELVCYLINSETDATILKNRDRIMLHSHAATRIKPLLCKSKKAILLIEKWLFYGGLITN